MKIYHKGFNYSQDGPGNRLVYHLQGCDLSCRWCSNPESMPFDSAGATEVPAAEILREAVSCRPLFFDGGGVTFTGGEPTVQFDELRRALSLLKGADINTCVENNATHPLLTELSELVDFMIADLKHFDTQKHRKYTGAGNETVLENLRILSEKRSQLLIRIPLINGVNDDAQGFIRALSALRPGSFAVEVLRYHEFGKAKWKTEYTIKDGFVSDEKYRLFTQELAANGVMLETH